MQLNRVFLLSLQVNVPVFQTLLTGVALSPQPLCVNVLKETYELVINLSVCLSAGALHQSECEEECLSEHTESRCPAQRVLHHLLRHTHTPTQPPPPPFRRTYTLHFRAFGHVHILSHIMYRYQTGTILRCSYDESCELTHGNVSHRHTDRLEAP